MPGGPREIKQVDFDDNIDILPVSDPNIFSMSQRVTLAQNQLQLAQSNPQMHNLREAYRRMYIALGVKDICRAPALKFITCVKHIEECISH